MPCIWPCFCNNLVECPVVTEILENSDRIGVEQLFAHSSCLLLEDEQLFCAILIHIVLSCVRAFFRAPIHRCSS